MFKFSMHVQQYIKLVLFVSFSVSHYFHKTPPYKRITHNILYLESKWAVNEAPP